MFVKNEISSPADNTNNFSKIWGLYIRFIASLVALFYLVFIPLKGIDQNHRLDATEAGILITVLLFNSPLLDKLEKLQFGREGVKIDLNSRLKANTEVNQKESKALALLGTFIEDNEKQKAFFDLLLYDGEKEILERMFMAEKSNKTFLYKKEEQDFVQRLRHLRLLGFIDSLYAIDNPIDELPEQGDLTKYFSISCTGKLCLALGSSKISTTDIVNGSVSDSECHKILSHTIER